MKKLFLGFAILSCHQVLEGNTENAERAIKRVYSHLLIHDPLSGEKEAIAAIGTYPYSKPLWQAYIKTLAKGYNEKSMLEAWQSYISAYPEEVKNRDLLEAMVWGILNKGASSTSPIIRIFAMLGAHFSQDAKGIEILLTQLKDQNALLRSAAVKLSSSTVDAKLRDEIKSLFKNENNWLVRQEVINAVGTMLIKELQPDLVALISNDTASVEEKALAIQALVLLLETADREEVTLLASSDRAGLRDLASQVVGFFELHRDLDLIVPLINDNRAEVRESALSVLATLRISEYQNQPLQILIQKRLTDLDPSVGMMASRVLTLHDPGKGQRTFQKWLNHKNRETRLKAAATLASCGNYGLPLIQQVFQETKDPYIKMNLAIGLIGLRVDTDAACQALYEGLTTSKEKWMWNEEGAFKFLTPSKVKHDDLIPNYPEAVNQMTRLEILNLLAVMKFPKSQEAIKRFLQERGWGISGMASAMLLTEGDESAIDLVEGLLQDPDPKIQLQAALILAMWGGGENAIGKLQEVYPTVDRELKEKILEGLGRIGSEKSIPFLAERLTEPYQTLRIIAASSLLLCLYH